jgi:serine/threonine protein kinase
MTTLQYPYSECTNVGSVYRAVSSGLKPLALAKIKDQKIIEFVCSCLEEDVNKRLSSSALLSHPFLTETESDGQYIALCSDEEIHQATLIIGSPPTKQGWELWIQKIVVPIRESRQRSKNNSLQHASPPVSDVILEYEPTHSQPSIDTSDQVVDSIEYQPRSSNKVFNNTFKKEEEDHDEIIEDDPTTIPTKQITTNIKTDSPHITPVAIHNIERVGVESANNSSRLGTPHTTANTVQFSTPPPKEEGSNTRWHNQITKNLQELHLSHRETPNTISSQSLPSTLHTTGMSSPASNQTNLASSLIAEHKYV